MSYKSLSQPQKKIVDVVLSEFLKNPKQKQFVNCTAKRIIVCAGRRGGKTFGVSQRSIFRFLNGRRQLYAAPTSEQVESFWFNVVTTLRPMIAAGILYKNESEHVIEYPGTKQRIKAKTAWNADTLRGDYADDLILDEWQLMNEDAWGLVGAPMLLDNDGDACFIYTPISLHPGKKFTSKANDPQHAAKMYKKAVAEVEANKDASRWAAFHWTSKDNGYISAEAVEELAGDMTAVAYRQEIEAEDIDQAPGALWTREIIEKGRLDKSLQYDRELLPLDRIVVAIDPSGSTTGDEAGIVVAGERRGDFYLLADRSLQGRPEQWGQAAIDAYYEFEADRIVGESNYGGLMVESTIKLIDQKVPVKLVHASHGKAIRAEPVSAVYEKGHGHHVGEFAKLENEMCLWQPGMPSPNRMDAAVWAGTELLLGPGYGLFRLWQKQAEELKAKGEDTRETVPTDASPRITGDVNDVEIRRKAYREKVVENELMRKLQRAPQTLVSARTIPLCPVCKKPLSVFSTVRVCNSCGYRTKEAVNA